MDKAVCHETNVEAVQRTKGAALGSSIVARGPTQRVEMLRGERIGRGVQEVKEVPKPSIFETRTLIAEAAVITRS